MNYYHTNKLKIAIIPAVIFWAVSMVFFIMGLVFDNRTPLMFCVAVALAIANTVIQVIGNDLEDEMTGVMRIGWYMSYVLGIGSNVYSLTQVLQIQQVVIEYAVCISLGSMIEILPEKLFVMFLKSIDPSWTLGTSRRSSNIPAVQPQRKDNEVLNRVRQGYGSFQNNVRTGLGLEGKDHLGQEKTPVQKPMPRLPAHMQRPAPTYHPVTFSSVDGKSNVPNNRFDQ
jgi:hypothetical protein